MTQRKTPAILYVSSFPPRECGIATFSQDLTNAMDKEFGSDLKSRILALNFNGTSIYNYPRKVVMQINESEIEDYLNRANEINRSPWIKLVNIQHEYGLYGGDWGEYLLFFLEMIKKPIVITMHTILPNPQEKLRKLTRSLAARAAAVIVMTKTSADLLAEAYGVNRQKIHVVPHGVHHIAFPSKTNAKKKLGLAGHTVLSTFGMLNRDKGIEYAIEALPEVVAEHPDVIYLVLGATHPLIIKQEGEKYRNKLKRAIMKYGLKDNVKFYDKYLELSELIDFLKATDIYISPTLNPKQAVSGTISYALSCACPIVSTANQYARDVIDASRGVLVRFKKSGDIKKALLEMLADKKAREEMKKSAYFYSRHMTWQNVALSYFNIFNKLAKIMPRQKGKLPPIDLNHIRTLTDKFGMIQFAQHTKPDKYAGYCLDDNARALFGFTQIYEKKRLESTLNMMNTYLKFIKFAQKTNGRFYNFIGYDRKFNDMNESEDSLGRAVWALGYLLQSGKAPDGMKKRAGLIFKKILSSLPQLSSLRAIAFTLEGLAYAAADEAYPRRDEIVKLITRLGDRLVRIYDNHAQSSSDPAWRWFEDCLTYSNYKLPEALFHAYGVTKNKDYLRVAEASLDFLVAVTFENKEYFSPIGQDGWYFRNGKRSYYDQQPEDAASAVEALVAAHLATRKKIYKDKAELAFQWFLGKNHLSQMVYDEATGGCYDGLGKYSLNFNQGAESTISYLLARLAIEKIV